MVNRRVQRLLLRYELHADPRAADSDEYTSATDSHGNKYTSAADSHGNKYTSPTNCYEHTGTANCDTSASYKYTSAADSYVYSTNRDGYTGRADSYSN